MAAQSSNNLAWYEQWFNTHYYHLLYQHRDDVEAQLFIKNLIKATPTQSNWHFLDLACGRGRHAKFLNQQGFEVTGLDLAPQNIAYAQQFAGPNLHFKQANMLEPYGQNSFNAIVNLFTSFGYFNTKAQSLLACQQMKKALKPGGYLWLDFMNVNKVALGLVPKEYKTVGDIEFCIVRKIENGQVIKDISFTDEGQPYNYQEKVQLLELADFEALFSQAGLKLQATYGSYQFEPFQKNKSERLIMMARA